MPATTTNIPLVSFPGKVYLVGGAVRDQLLGIQSKDKDWVVVGATEQDMLDRKFEKVGQDFPVFLHPTSKEEYALARTERKSGAGYYGFVCDASPNVTLEEDLSRRDLTINALAFSEASGVVDPYGGQRDIEDRVLRHVSPAFAEDPLRVLRVARFAARFAHLDFRIAPETLTLMTELSAGDELLQLNAERIWQETERALTEKSPWVYFEILQQCGALKVIMPELDSLFGVPQPETYHPEIDTGLHALLSLNAATILSRDTSVRFAALIHDLGKGLTPMQAWPSHHGHEKKGVKPIKALCKRLRVPNAHTKLAALSSEYHTHVHRAFELKPETVLKVIKALDAFRKPEQFERFLLVCKADAQGRTGFEDAKYAQAEYFQQALEISKSIDISALRETGIAGKELGEAIDQARIENLRAYKHQASEQPF
jgi:tRNA nucleotidyltransferase (CCA-adding enzyme)